MTSSRTLVVLPNWVGDTVMAIPVLESLAATDRHITALGRPHLAPLLSLLSGVDDVLVREKSTRATIRRLKQRNFEEAVILPNSFRSAWLPFRAGIPVRWGYRGDFRSVLLEPAVPRPTGFRHQLGDYDYLLERLGSAAPRQASPTLALTPAAREKARERLQRGGIELEGAAIVGVFPGAEFGPSKRWAPAKFAELSAKLADESTVQPVLIAGPGEESLAQTVRDEADRSLPILGPDLDLAELGAVLAELRVLVTNDSGPMHIAAAVGTTCIALFGPTNPNRTAPSGSRHHLLYTNRWCSPCFKKRCPLFHQRCMQDISVGQVERVVTETVAEPIRR